jgi:hypothetical protein
MWYNWIKGKNTKPWTTKATYLINHIPKESWVYRIKSNISWRCYYGSSVNMNYRILKHIYSLNKNKHKNIYLQRHFNKYWLSDLIFDVLYIWEDFIEKEQIYIDSKSNDDFNILLDATWMSSEDWRKNAKIWWDLWCHYQIWVKQYDIYGRLVWEFKSVKSAYRHTWISARIIKESIDIWKIVFWTYFYSNDTTNDWWWVKYESLWMPFAKYKNWNILDVYSCLNDAESKEWIKWQSIHYWLKNSKLVLWCDFRYISDTEYYMFKYK